MSSSLPVLPQHPYDNYGPDWIMLGVPRGDQVMVFASTELDRAEIEMIRDWITRSWDSLIPATAEIRLQASMRTCQMAIAADYRTAIRILLDQGWAPQQRIAITS